MSPCSAVSGPVSGHSKHVATLKGRNKQTPVVLDEPQKLWRDDEDGKAASCTRYPKYDPCSSEIQPSVSRDQK